jgi:hypothetical protein
MVTGAAKRAFRQGFWWAALAFVAACGERDRLTFPNENPGDGVGPVTEITHPSAPDTVVTDGDLLIIQGRAFDPDGVDSIYFDVGGVNQGFAPINGEGADTVNFALQISTLGSSGATIVLQAYGVDLLGGQGALVSRQIRVE